jgi:phage shock protein PspC (stress-responsive transcriptional regulator)
MHVFSELSYQRKFILMTHALTKIKGFLELNAFGVCSALGNWMGIATSKIRLFFIYITFMTMGSPILIYLSLAFLININHYIRLRKRNPVRDF